MTEVERLQTLLKEMGGTLVHVEKGPEWNRTSIGDRARAIRESLERVLAGDYEEVNFDEDC